MDLGLGKAQAIRKVEVRWPSGKLDRMETLEAGFVYAVEEGSGVKDRTAFVRR